MKINDDHMFHGAALTQIAEHPQFTAINAFYLNDVKSRSSFRVNNDIGVYLKYASEPTKSYSEYVFTFSEEHLNEIERLKAKTGRTFIVFVCVKDKQICCVSYEELQQLIDARERAKGERESNYTVLVTAPKGKSLRLYLNAPGVKKTTLRKRIIPRNRFPEVIFE